MLRRVASRLVFGFVISVYLTLCVISSNPFDPGGGGEQENQDANVVISPKQCTQNEEGVILVHSFAGNFELRSSQRNAKKELGAEELKFVFVLFYSNDVNMDLVSKESNMHSDILLGDREESYKGLVYKHLMGMKWVDKNCSKVTRVIKMDDDISIDFPRLISTAERSLPTTSPLYMAGLLQITLPILRSRLSKWGVSEVEMPGTTYPDFLSGWCYLTTPATIRAVLAVYQEGQAVFWIDDVWVTGILGAKAKVKLISLNLYYTVYRTHLTCCTKEPGLECPFLVGPTDSNSRLLAGMAQHNRRCQAPASCLKRSPAESLERTCKVDNPLFLPSSRAHAEIFYVT